MIQKFTLLFTLFILIGLNNIKAQTDPGTSNLTHQWTFDDGTAKDAVTTNPVNGTLISGATVVNKALKLSAAGQYVTFSASAIAINTYTAVSQEIWFTSVAGGNTGYTMLSYFGSTTGTQGYYYISTSAARGDNVSRIAITNGTYNSEVYANGSEYDDGLLHQMVSVISADSVILYIDGKLISKTKNTVSISSVYNTYAYLGKGGYTSDPTWLGSVSKFSIYNKSLTASEVLFLFQQGAEQSPIISASRSNLSFDNIYKSESIAITGINLTDSIALTAPAGITLSATKLSPSASNVSVTITYDGTTTVDGNLSLTSGSTVVTIPVKSYNNDCFTKLYPTVTNLITDPYVSSLANFAGWGTRSINSDHTYVYCGATSGKVTGSNAGSLDVSLTGKLKPSTIYRVKAKVYCVGGTFQIGIFGWSGSNADLTKSITTTNSWQNVDYTFTTGSSLGSTQGIFFNNYGLTGTTGYIDNWEMYAIPKVYVSPSMVSFPSNGTKYVAVRGESLSQDINISAPAGFSVSPATMASNVSAGILSITFNSASAANGYVYFTSGDIKDSIYVSGSVAPTLVTSKPLVVVDEINNTATFTVNGYNLTTDVILSAPAGITLNPSTLPSSVSGTTVTVTYDGIANSSGTISLTSGTALANIALTAARNEECFTPLYPNATNLITDPTCNSNITGGWGTISINSDPTYVFCGSRSAKVTTSGSLERNLTGLLKTNTQYRVKAKIYKQSSVKPGNMGNVTFTLSLDSASFPSQYNLIKIAMDSACKYYSKYTPFIFNISVYYDPGIPTAQANYHGSIGFGSNTRYMWVGTAIHEMAHYFGSGTTSIWQSKIVNGSWTGAIANALMMELNGTGISGDSQHFWPYGINQKEEITNLGSLAVQDKALSDAVRVVKAMLVDDCALPTNNPAVGVGVSGWDAASNDIYNEVTIANTWQDVDFTFTTGSSLKATQSVYFNSGTGYIDNWEMYEVPTSDGINNLSKTKFNIYTSEGNIITEFELSNRTNATFSVYDLHGRLISSENRQLTAGTKHEIIDATNVKGVVFVKITTGTFIVSKKLLMN